MSGWIGVANLHGEPLDPEVVAQLIKPLRFRGPDAEGVRIFNNVGFGHTLLRTTFEAERETQPCSVDGTAWITADCRIDGRADLIRDLRGRGQAVSGDVTDPELILHAYAVWGTACTDHLLGDFSFAIFDPHSRQLFLARDQIGIKLLYYARFKDNYVFGNTIQSLLSHPAAPRRLNDLAIADFLVFGINQDPETTSFEGIYRLRPGHSATLSLNEGRFTIERYWILPIDEPLRLKSRSEYPAQFRTLLQTVVSDRLRTSRIGIQMSGGLDSGTMAVAASAASAKSGNFRIKAYTGVLDSLIEDEERLYANLTAAQLGIPIEFLSGVNEARFYDVYPRGVPLPDPVFVSLWGGWPPSGILDAISAGGARVSLYGEGPDNALFYEWKAYVRHEAKSGHWGSLLRDAVAFPFLFGSVPMWGRLSARARPCEGAEADPLPVWLRADLVDRLHLRDRVARPPTVDEVMPSHPVRPYSYSTFSIREWQLMFEGFDHEVTRAGVEVRHPFMDIRMLRFLLSLPVIPWCRDKFLIRHSMRDALPAAVLSRPKTGVSSSISFQIWQRYCHGARFLESSLAGFLWSGSSVSDYVDIELLNRQTTQSQYSLAVDLRPRALGFFLQSLS